MTTKIEGSTGIQFPDASVQSTASPGEQTWQDVTGSRTWGQYFVNNTPHQIMVSMYADSIPGVNLIAGAQVGAVAVTNLFIPSSMADVFSSGFSFLVPSGSSYTISLIGASNAKWMELR